MPGSYPPVADPRTQTPSTTVPYSSTTTTTVTTPSQRRTSGNSFKDFLSGFRRSSGKENHKPRISTDTTLSGSIGHGEGGAHDAESRASTQQRPSTPGGSSVVDSVSGQSLRKRMSGAFGRKRKSSLSNVLGQEDLRSQYTSSPRSVGTDFTTDPEQGSPSSPTQRRNGTTDRDGETSSLLKVRRKISSTFRTRRKSSLRMELEPETSSASALPSDPDKDRPYNTPSLSSNKRARSPTFEAEVLSTSPPSTLRKRQSGSFWRRKGNINTALNDQIPRDGSILEPRQQQQQQAPPQRMDLDEDYDIPKQHPQQQEVIVSRTPTPPPVLPELKLGGELGKGDSGIFMDEGIFERITS